MTLNVEISCSNTSIKRANDSFRSVYLVEVELVRPSIHSFHVSFILYWAEPRASTSIRRNCFLYCVDLFWSRSNYWLLCCVRATISNVCRPTRNRPNTAKDTCLIVYLFVYITHSHLPLICHWTEHNPSGMNHRRTRNFMTTLNYASVAKWM